MGDYKSFPHWWSNKVNFTVLIEKRNNFSVINFVSRAELLDSWISEEELIEDLGGKLPLPSKFELPEDFPDRRLEKTLAISWIEIKNSSNQ